MKLFFLKTAINMLLISNRNSFRVLFNKIASVYFISGNIFILSLEMTGPGNQHYAS